MDKQNNSNSNNTPSLDINLKIKKERINSKQQPKSDDQQTRRNNQVNPYTNDKETANNLNKTKNQLPNKNEDSFNKDNINSGNNGFENKNANDFNNKNASDFNNKNEDAFNNEGLSNPSDDNLDTTSNELPKDELESNNDELSNDLEKPNNLNNNDNELNQVPNNNNLQKQNPNDTPNQPNNVNNDNNVAQNNGANTQNKRMMPANNNVNNGIKDPTQNKLDRLNRQKQQQDNANKENEKPKAPANNKPENPAGNTPKTPGSAPKTPGNTPSTPKVPGAAGGGGIPGGGQNPLNKMNEIKQEMEKAQEEGVGEAVKSVAKKEAKEALKRKIKEKLVTFFVNFVLPVLPYVAIVVFTGLLILFAVFAVMGVFDDEDVVYPVIKVNYCDHVNLKWGEAPEQSVTISLDEYIKYKINNSQFKIINDEGTLQALSVVYRTNLVASSDNMDGNICYYEIDSEYTKTPNDVLDKAVEAVSDKVYTVSVSAISSIAIDEHFTYVNTDDESYRLFQDKFAYKKDWVNSNIGVENMTTDSSSVDAYSFSPFAAWYLSVVHQYNPLALIYHFVTPGSQKGNMYRIEKLTNDEDPDDLYNSACSDISLSDTSLDRQQFIDKVNSYNDSHADMAVFKANAGKIYDISKNNNFNPEMVVIRAVVEGFSPGGSTYNYWGIGCPNGKNCSNLGINSFDDGVLRYISTVKKINSVSLFQMQRKYSYIGSNWFNPGGPGSGGCYYFPYLKKYLSESRASEVENACTSGATCSGTLCLPTTDEDQDAYTRYQIESMLNARGKIFGISVDDCEAAEDEIVYDVPPSEIGAAVAKYAVQTYDSYQYSQDSGLRMQVGYVDCSSLIYRAYKHFGMSIVSGSVNTSGLLKWCDVNERTITGDSLAPGDLIFYNTGSRSNSEHYRGVGHVEIYIGNGSKFGAHTHYEKHPEDDVNIKPYKNDGNIFCRPASGA